MESLKLEIHNIRCIKDAVIEFPFDNGIYTLVGTNGCGKSTIMFCMSQLMMRQIQTLKDGFKDDSYVKIAVDSAERICKRDNNSWIVTLDSLPRFNGLYEGSLFYGTRFEDSSIIEEMILKNQIPSSEISDADDYVKNQLSYILHGDLTHYRTLKRIKNRGIASRHKIKNLPYFIEVDGHLISQYRMSSGECLLISLMHFLYNAIERRSLPTDQKVIILIDELELALHPVAVLRLVDYLKDLAHNHSNLVVYLSSHSPEVIKTMHPMNLFKVNNVDGVITIEQNCYPSYLIRDLYSNVSPDYLLLVEDELAALVLNKVLSQSSLRTGRLIHCVPVGGWRNVLDLHKELYTKKVLGNSARIISVLDGDIANQLDADQNRLPHLFLPIASVEKFLYGVIKENKNPYLKRILNDKYFIVDSLTTIVSDYNKMTLNGRKDTNKSFYKFLCDKLNEMGTSEDVFVSGLCDEIMDTIDFSEFSSSLHTMLTV